MRSRAAAPARDLEGVQLRLDCQLTAEEYVSQRFWAQASLPPCPAHSEGACGFCRHTPYERKNPPGTWIARGYCRLAHLTVSLLPDFLASRLPATLDEVEAVVEQVEQRPGSLEELAGQLRPAAKNQDRVSGGLRWMRRRCRPLVAVLVAIKGLMPHLFANHPPTLSGFRAALGVDRVLVTLRQLVAQHLGRLPPPLGFGPRPTARRKAARRLQQEVGTAPPETPG